MLLISLLLSITIGGMIAFLVYAEGSPGIASAEVGTVVSFLAYLGLFAGRLGSVSTALGKIQGSLANLDRMAEFLDLPESEAGVLVEGGGTTGITLEVTGLSGAVAGRTVFENVGFSAAGGEIIAIRGRSGAGKTTLLKTLFGLHPRSGGSILVNGRPVEGLRDLGDSAVLMPQEIRLFPGTLEWNLEVLAGSTPDGSRISSVLGGLRLGERLDAAPPGSVEISEAGANLSGGEKQRLALAAVLLRNPRILLLDEPTSQLDAETENLILATVRDLALKGTIILLVTHNPDIEQMTGRIIDLGQVF
jgi:ATP-binding cassette subfamily B protein RaxB